jgi:hypothetical protein
MSWLVADSSDDPYADENRQRFEDYETTDALAEFFRRVSKRETAVLIWSY